MPNAASSRPSCDPSRPPCPCEPKPTPEPLGTARDIARDIMTDSRASAPLSAEYGDQASLPEAADTAR